MNMPQYQMNAQSAAQGCSVGISTQALGREPISADVIHIAATLATRAEELAGHVSAKLSPITTFPETCCDKPVENICDWPPFFAELRNYFKTVNSALDQIEDTMKRTEL